MISIEQLHESLSLLFLWVVDESRFNPPIHYRPSSSISALRLCSDVAVLDVTADFFKTASMIATDNSSVLSTWNSQNILSVNTRRSFVTCIDTISVSTDDVHHQFYRYLGTHDVWSWLSIYGVIFFTIPDSLVKTTHLLK